MRIGARARDDDLITAAAVLREQLGW